MNIAVTLQGKLDALNQEIEKLQVKLRPSQQELSRLQSERQAIIAKLADAQKKPNVSDHALIRYCERVHGIDFDEMREAIMTENVKAAIRMGAKSVKANGITLRIAGSTIVTVVD